MSTDVKKALLIFGVGFALFYILRPKRKKVTAETNIKYKESEETGKDRVKIASPTMSPKSMKKNPLAKNGFMALKAYVDAYNNNEPQSVLDELNREFSKEFKVQVKRRKSDDKLVVTDMTGREIMVNNG